MSQPINTALVGFGISGKVFHAPFLDVLDEYEWTTVLERHREEAHEKYPYVKTVRSMEELLKDDAIELVVITTPNETHFPYTQQALEAGKHVVLEKPFTNTSGEARQLIDIAQKNNRILSVYQNRRYVSDFLTIRDVLDQQLLGAVHDFEAHYDRYRSEARPTAWREAPLPGSGILYDLGAHLIDQSLCLFGLPNTIFADIRQQRPHARVDDNFTLCLDYGYTKVTLKAGMLVREPGPRYIIHGAIGSFLKYGEDPQEALLRAGQSPVGSRWGQEPEDIAGLLHTEKDGQLVRERYPSRAGNYGLYYQNLYQTIREGAPLKEKPEQSHNVIRLIELAFESHRQQRVLACSRLLEA